MLIRSTALAALLAIGTSAGVSLQPANAQAVLPDGTVIGAPELDEPMTAADARDIAADNGVATDSVEWNSGSGRWEIDGRDEAGRDVQMEIDGNTGSVVQMDRD